MARLVNGRQMENRRQKHTPFKSDGVLILDAQGAQVAICTSAGHGEFIVRACNNYDALFTAARACASELQDSLTHPITRPLLRDLITLLTKLEKE